MRSMRLFVSFLPLWVAVALLIIFTCLPTVWYVLMVHQWLTQ